MPRRDGSRHRGLRLGCARRRRPRAGRRSRRRRRVPPALGRRPARRSGATSARSCWARPSASASRTTSRRALDRRPDVLIDYTHPAVVRRNVDLALERSVPVVIGTTGLTDADFDRIDAAARARRRRRGHRQLLGHRGADAAPGPLRGPARRPTGRSSSTARPPSRTRPAAPPGSWPSCSRTSAPASPRRRSPSRSARRRRAAPRSAAPGCTRCGWPDRIRPSRSCSALPGERLILRHDEQGDSGDLRGAARCSPPAACASRPGLVRGLDTPAVRRPDGRRPRSGTAGRAII